MKTAVIYWSGTGNTEAMAKAVAEGAGAECFAVSEFSGNVEDYDAIALGCPAMGAEGCRPTRTCPAPARRASATACPVADFDKALEMFNQVNPALAASE